MHEHLRWTIGRLRVTRVEERIVPLRWSDLIPDGPALLDTCRPWIDPHVSADGSHLLLSVHSFVVETPETCIVVDTCIGRDDLAFEGDAGFGPRLEAVLPGGFEGVDVVVCTHLHFDHIGWNTVEIDGELRPRFPNATYVVTREELAADRDDEDGSAYHRSIAPLVAAGCLDAVDGSHRIDHWVSLEPTPGHTPGHVSIRLLDGDHQAVISGDIVHSALQFAHPGAGSSSDQDPDAARASRTRIIDQVTNTDTLVLGTHVPPPTAGRIRRTEGRVTFE